jgi:hypothetical protein
MRFGRLLYITSRMGPVFFVFLPRSLFCIFSSLDLPLRYPVLLFLSLIRLSSFVRRRYLYLSLRSGLHSLSNYIGLVPTLARLFSVILFGTIVYRIRSIIVASDQHLYLHHHLPLRLYIHHASEPTHSTLYHHARITTHPEPINRQNVLQSRRTLLRL